MNRIKFLIPLLGLLLMGSLSASLHKSTDPSTESISASESGESKMRCSQNIPGQLTGNQTIHDLLVTTVSKEKIPGMIAAIADSNGIRIIESAGVRKAGSTEPITITDQFHLGSCTKAMTSAVLATMVAKGEIKWESTIIDIFPELKNSIDPGYHTVTLQQLLTHRGGIPADAANWWSYQILEIKERRLSILKDNLKKPGPTKSGDFKYSNLGYMIAGCMAERITGKTWEALIKERLFEPLGMHSAGFGPPGSINGIDQPWGHIMDNGRWKPLQSDNAVALGPAGRVHCNLEDWVKFISVFLKRDNTSILDRNLLNKLIDPTGDYAFGWVVAQRPWAHGIAITHSGSNTAWFITVWIAPEINRAFIVGTNSFNQKTAAACDEITGKLIGI